MRPTPTIFSGTARLHIRSSSEDVTYELKGDPAKLRRAGHSSPGSALLKGAIHTTPEIAALAFREGRAVLELEHGQRYPVVVVAHSQGDSRAFVEVEPA